MRRVTVAAALLLIASLSCDDVTDAGAAPSWLESRVIPLATADPAVDDPNLLLLDEIIGDARIVGMGEATHGTTEFWQIRQKLSKYLVENMGFTAILHEAPLPNSLYIDAYVTRGEGSALEAHQRLGYWRFQEMQDLIAWMREYNVQRGGEEPPLHYYGYDCAFLSWTEPTNLIAGYLETVDPTAVTDITARLENYTVEDARYVYDFLAANAAAYVALSSEEEFELILKIAENLEPSWQIWYNIRNEVPETDVREGFNIGNVNWIIEHLLDGGKVIIWAHNGHVWNGYLEDVGGIQARSVGARLKEQYGDDYYIIGTEFYGGQFMAWDVCDGYYSAFVVHQAALPKSNTYEFRLQQAGEPLFFLDVSGIDESVDEASWLMGPMNSRVIGASYCQRNDAEFYYSIPLPVYYDGLVHFESTNPVTRITF
ncbi:MAG: erythromycin esterase family protein [Gemmatimonadota bacterium]|nr:MAG: erythromycin esterase family protein [Gemmatimonadota bacterium]